MVKMFWHMFTAAILDFRPQNIHLWSMGFLNLYCDPIKLIYKKCILIEKTIDLKVKQKDIMHLRS